MSTESNAQERLQLALLILKAIRIRTNDPAELSMVTTAIEVIEGGSSEEVLISIAGITRVLDKYIANRN